MRLLCFFVRHDSFSVYYIGSEYALKHDFHLAKRFYDSALEASPAEALWPVRFGLGLLNGHWALVDWGILEPPPTILSNPQDYYSSLTDDMKMSDSFSYVGETDENEHWYKRLMRQMSKLLNRFYLFLRRRLSVYVRKTADKVRETLAGARGKLKNIPNFTLNEGNGGKESPLEENRDQEDKSSLWVYGCHQLLAITG